MDYPLKATFVEEMEAKYQAAISEYWNQFPKHPRLGEYLADNGFETKGENPGLEGNFTYYRGEEIIDLQAVDTYLAEKDAIMAAIEAKKPVPPEPAEDLRTPIQKLQDELAALE